MQTVLMAIAIIVKDEQILIRKFDPAKNPYQEPWGLFGGRLEGEGTIVEMLNRELNERWNMSVKIREQLTWNEDQKVDHDGKEKRFIYLDALCELESGDPVPVNLNEELKWIHKDEISKYQQVPPGVRLFKKLGWLLNSSCEVRLGKSQLLYMAAILNLCNKSLPEFLFTLLSRLGFWVSWLSCSSRQITVYFPSYYLSMF